MKAPSLTTVWTAFPATWCSGGRSSAITVERPAEPHACSSDDSASSTANVPTSSAPRPSRIGTRASAPARSQASQEAIQAAGRPARNRPNAQGPSAAGSVKAAAQTASQSHRRSAGASSSASQLTATVAIPSPRAETATPGQTRRSCGCRSTGR